MCVYFFLQTFLMPHPRDTELMVREQFLIPDRAHGHRGNQEYANELFFSDAYSTHTRARTHIHNIMRRSSRLTKFAVSSDMPSTLTLVRFDSARPAVRSALFTAHIREISPESERPFARRRLLTATRSESR